MAYKQSIVALQMRRVAALAHRVEFQHFIYNIDREGTGLCILLLGDGHSTWNRGIFSSSAAGQSIMIGIQELLKLYYLHLRLYPPPVAKKL